MSPRIDWLVGCTAAGCILSTGLAFAQTASPESETPRYQTEPRIYQPGETYYESNLNRSLGSSENALQTQYRQTTESQQLLWKALAAHRKALSNYQKTKTELQHEYNQSPELAAAHKKLAAAEQRFQDARAAVIQRLEHNPEYHDAVFLREDSSAMLKQLADDPNANGLRQHVAKKLIDAMSRTKELEDRAINSDSAARTALRRRQAVTDEVAQLKADSHEAMEKDTRLTSAELAKQRTRNEIKTQQRDLAANFQQFLRMQNGYQQLVQQRLGLEQSQRANSWVPWIGWRW